MKTLVLGASGATGKLVVAELLKKNFTVRIVVRESAVMPAGIIGDSRVESVTGNIDDFDRDGFEKLVLGCDSVVCCLGHNISLKGLFGPPRSLVANAVKNVTDAVSALGKPVKLILMSTTAYTDRSRGEKNGFGETLIFSVLERLLPPHRDNMRAADHLVYGIGVSETVEWIAVRPDSLFNEERESGCDIHESRIRSPIFNAGKTSRINVARFIVDLLENADLWRTWKFTMPVVYNRE